MTQSGIDSNCIEAIVITLEKERVSLQCSFIFFICISLPSDQRQPRKLIPKGSTSGLCYLVCLQGAWNEIMKTLIFPLTHLSQRGV